MMERLNYMLAELKRAQDANGNGYLSGVPQGKKIWNEIEQGEINAGSFSLNHKWVPLYNIHKIYAGLYDTWLYTGNEQAKEMLIKLTDWAIHLVQNLSEEQIQDMLRSEHGGLFVVFSVAPRNRIYQLMQQSCVDMNSQSYLFNFPEYIPFNFIFSQFIRVAKLF